MSFRGASWIGALALAWVWLGVASVVAQAPAPPAEAPEAASATATVVALDGDQLVLDLGKSALAPGALLRLYRTIEVKHPVTGKPLRDRFPNGTARVVQTGDALSLAVPVEAPPRAPAVGDSAELERPASTVRTVAPACTECMRVVEVQREILELWYGTLGKPPEERLALLRGFLEEHPASPYKSWLESEISFYGSGALSASAQRLGKQAADEALGAVVHAAPMAQAQAGLPLWAGIYVPPETIVRDVRLWVRSGRSGGEYKALKVPLDVRGQGRVEIPSALVRAPGFAYFYELSFDDNRSLAVLGSSDKPAWCTVRPKPGAPLRANMSRVRAASEYVSFDGLNGHDYFYLFEADFLLRLPRRVLDGVRMGYGHYRGHGGTVKELDEDELDPQPAAFTYGYLELSLAVHELFAILPRLEVGLGRPFDENNSLRSRVKGGGQLRLRIGRARGTHLVLAAETVPEIGERAFVGLTLGLLEKWPIAFEVHVTDQPVNTDELGVRAVFELGYRPSDVFSLAARASLQGRTINHMGPGFGLAATFDW
jgi:hypothetical protein